MAFPCAEPCFQARSGDELLAAVRDFHVDYGKIKDLTVCEVIEALCSENYMTGYSVSEFRGLTALNLFTLVSGGHSDSDQS